MCLTCMVANLCDGDFGKVIHIRLWDIKHQYKKNNNFIVESIEGH